MKLVRKKDVAARFAIVLATIILANIIVPSVNMVQAAGYTTIGNSNITNVEVSKTGNALSGTLDYRIPSSITEDNSILKYDFSQVLAYSKDAENDWQTTGESALDFHNFNLSGPIIVQNSHFNDLYSEALAEYNRTGDAEALKAAGYPYSYYFDENGVVYLDYSAAYETYDDNGVQRRDIDDLLGSNATSYVVFTCDLNENAFFEAGGDYRLTFVTDVIEDARNPQINIKGPSRVDRDIDVQKVCTNFDFENGTVDFSITVKNNGAQTITTPIEFKDDLDVGLKWGSVNSFDSRYISDNSTKNTYKTHYFTLNNLPSGESTTITYTCLLSSAFYSQNQTPTSSNAGNTVSGKTIPEGGTTPVPVELNDNHDIYIRVVPNVYFEKMTKTGEYNDGIYNWSISINNGDLRSDLSDVVLYDNNVYNTDNNPEILNGTVTITNANNPSLSYVVSGVSIASFKNSGITFNASWFNNEDADGIYIGSSTDTYVITYATTTGENVDSLTVDQTVNNTAYITSNGREIGRTSIGVDGPTGNPDPYTLTAAKDIDEANVTYSEDSENTTINMPWIFTVNVPADYSGSIVLTDTIARDYDMSFDFSRMSSTVANIYYLNDNGEEVLIPATLETKVLGNGANVLEAVITSSDAISLRGKTIYWRVCTTATVPTFSLVKNGQIFHNDGRVNDIGLDAFFTTRGPVYIMNKHGEKFNSNSSVATWTLVFNSDNTGHVLEANNWTSIHVIDNLNGMEFLGYSGNSNRVWVSINNDDGNNYYAYAHDNGDGTFEIIVDDSHPLTDRNGNEYLLRDLVRNNERIVFKYLTYIPTDIYPITSPGRVTNTASCEVIDDNNINHHQDISTAYVNVTYPIIDKTPVGDVHDTNQLDFSITVNPHSLNLSRDNSGSYYVVDTLGDNIDYVVGSMLVYERGTSSTTVNYNSATDTLYTLDSVNDNHVAAGSYEFSIDGRDLILRIPDGKCITIYYTVRLNFTSSGTVTNSVSMPISLPGSEDESAGNDSTNGNYIVSSSSAGTRSDVLFYIDKVGENNPTEFLPGIRFTVEEYTLEGIATGNVFYGTTTSTGALSSNDLTGDRNNDSDATSPRQNYVYVLYENQDQVAPEGYTISSQRIAFYVPSNSNYVVNQTSCLEHLGMGVNKVEMGKHFIYVNSVNSLTINKLFDVNGADVSAVAFTIRGTGASASTFVDRQIERTGNRFIVSNLPIGTYEIVETSTASGFNRLSEAISVTVDSNKSITVTTPNGVSIVGNSNGTSDVELNVTNTQVTATPTPTATSTPVPTATNTPVPTATSTPVPTATSTPVPTATSTPVPTATSTPVPTATSTPVPTATNTPVPTATPTAIVPAPATPAPTATSTPAPTATSTPVPTATNTPVPTATSTPVPTATDTPVATPTVTETPKVTPTVAVTPTDTPVPTATSTPVPTATDTPAATPTVTETPTITPTVAPTSTITPGPSATESNTATPSPSATPVSNVVATGEDSSITILVAILMLISSGFVFYFRNKYHSKEE